MKHSKRTFIVLAAMLVVSLILSACKSNDENTITNSFTATATPDDCNKIMSEAEKESESKHFKDYDDVITEWQAALNRYIKNEEVENETFDFWFYNGYTDSINIYYALYDIDCNGITELLLKKQNEYGEDIIAYIFTMKNGEPVNLFGYDDEGLPCEVPWSRVGSGEILDNGLIDCRNGDSKIYKIAENGYSVTTFAWELAYDYPDEARRAEAKWRFFVDGMEVDYDDYIQCLDEQGYQVNGENKLANISWNSIQ